MGIKNYLIEGVSGTGKTTVAEELQRRGYHVLQGNRELAYWGDPKTGKPVDEPTHESEMDRVVWQQEHWLWNIDKVKSVIADHSNAISFFCGGSRNFLRFIDLLDLVFILDVDAGTLKQRLASRSEDEFGGRPVEQELVVRLHATKEDIPKGNILIDATAPLEHVVDEILKNAN
jgi:broad-specificity NMP kinase